MAEQVEDLTEDEISDILDRPRSATLVRKTALTKPPASTSDERDTTMAKFARLEEQLRRTETRQEGMQLLEEALTTKRQLERFARHLDLGVQRHDTLEMLREKIVATTIGYRIRSAAIRGETGVASRSALCRTAGSAG